MRRSVALVALLLAVFCGSSTSVAAELAPGTTSEVRLADGKSYVLYIPRAYTKSRPSPVLYCFDARGHGEEALERFRDAAEKFGWIVASSNDSRSDEANSPNPAAARAMWSDTHAKLSIDDRRIYAAGFSGAARAACLMREWVGHSVTGVIGCSGGFPFGEPPDATTPFDFFGTAGDRDFNYYELRGLDRTLASLGLAHALVIFDGAHEWPPADVAARAVEWMEVRAMKKGLRPVDASMVDALFTAEMQAAAAETNPVFAAESYARISSEFSGLHDVRAAETKRAAIAGTKDYGSLVADDVAREKRDTDYLANAAKIVGSIGAADPPSTAKLVEALDLRSWLKRSEDRQHVDEMLSAKRVLSTLLVQTVYYIPNLFRERGDAKREALSLSLAAEIKPDDASIWFQAASARAAAGERRGALEALEKAVEHGFKDRDAIAKEKRFDALRTDRKFLAVVAKM